MIDLVREQVRYLRAQFGEIIEVRLKKNNDVDVRFENGATITIEDAAYRCGYQGTGPLLFFTFLEEAGFKVSQEQVQQTKAPFVLTREPKKPVQIGQDRSTKVARSLDRVLAFYVFNSNKISDEVSGFYGAYAEGELLKALSKALEPRGGWMAIPSLVQACHGDLFEQSRLPGMPLTVRVLGNWLRAGTYGIDATNLDSSFVGKLKSGKSLDFIPYVVGMGAIQKSYALEAHEGLKDRNVVGYLGLFTLSAAPSFADVASELSLPFDMEIRGSKCRGWLVSSKVLRDAGLEG